MNKYQSIRHFGDRTQIKITLVLNKEDKEYLNKFKAGLSYSDWFIYVPSTNSHWELISYSICKDTSKVKVQLVTEIGISNSLDELDRYTKIKNTLNEFYNHLESLNYV